MQDAPVGSTYKPPNFLVGVWAEVEACVVAFRRVQIALMYNKLVYCLSQQALGIFISLAVTPHIRSHKLAIRLFTKRSCAAFA